MALETIDFDTVRVHFTVPQMDGGNDLSNVLLYYRQGQTALTDENAASAVQLSACAARLAQAGN